MAEFFFNAVDKTKNLKLQWMYEWWLIVLKIGNYFVRVRIICGIYFWYPVIET